jgi:hypothetical protein
MLGTVGTPGFGEPLVAGEAGYQVTAIGANGAESVRSGEVTLAKGEPLLRKLAVAPLPFDPRAGALTVTFELRETARVTWSIVDAEGRALTEEQTVSAAAGPGSVIWNGRNRNGAAAEPGVYRVALKATASAETDAQARAVPVLWGPGAGSPTGPLAGPTGTGGGVSAAGASGGGGAASTGGSGNNGVRDHGQGEGRDGAGQGQGQGSDHGRKGP